MIFSVGLFSINRMKSNENFDKFSIVEKITDLKCDCEDGNRIHKNYIEINEKREILLKDMKLEVLKGVIEICN